MWINVHFHTCKWHNHKTRILQTHTYTSTHQLIYYLFFSTYNLFNLWKKRAIFVITTIRSINIIILGIHCILIDMCIKCMQSNLIRNGDVLHKSEHRIWVYLLNNFHPIRFSHFKNLSQFALCLVCNYFKHTFFNEHLHGICLISMAYCPIEEHRFPSNIWPNKTFWIRRVRAITINSF